MKIGLHYENILKESENILKESENVDYLNQKLFEKDEDNFTGLKKKTLKTFINNENYSKKGNLLGKKMLNLNLNVYYYYYKYR